MSYPPFSDFTVCVIQSGSSQSKLPLLFDLSSKDEPQPWVLATSLIPPADTFMLYKEKKSESERERKSGSWVNTQAFPASGGVSHSHAGCLYWHTGLVQYYSTLPSLFGIVCFASCLHIWTRMLVRKQPPNIKPTTGTMGAVYWQPAKLTPGRHPKQSKRVKVWAENVTEILDLLDNIGSYTI